MLQLYLKPLSHNTPISVHSELGSNFRTVPHTSHGQNTGHCSRYAEEERQHRNTQDIPEFLKSDSNPRPSLNMQGAQNKRDYPNLLLVAVLVKAARESVLVALVLVEGLELVALVLDEELGLLALVLTEGLVALAEGPGLVAQRLAGWSVGPQELLHWECNYGLFRLA